MQVLVEDTRERHNCWTCYLLYRRGKIKYEDIKPSKWAKLQINEDGSYWFVTNAEYCDEHAPKAKFPVWSWKKVMKVAEVAKEQYRRKIEEERRRREEEEKALLETGHAIQRAGGYNGILFEDKDGYFVVLSGSNERIRVCCWSAGMRKINSRYPREHCPECPSKATRV